MVITVLLYGYMGAVGVAAVYVMPHPRLFGIGWRVLQALTVVLVLLFAVVAERLWRHRADIMGARRAAGIIMWWPRSPHAPHWRSGVYSACSCGARSVSVEPPRPRQEC